MQTISQFYRAHDIDPTVVTVKVNMYRVGSGINEKTVYLLDGAAWTTLCGEYWFSRKTSSYVYRPAFEHHPYYPQPDAEWLTDNRPSIKDLKRYGQVTP